MNAIELIDDLIKRNKQRKRSLEVSIDGYAMSGEEIPQRRLIAKKTMVMTFIKELQLLKEDIMNCEA